MNWIHFLSIWNFDNICLNLIFKYNNGLTLFIFLWCFISESLTRACSDRYGNFGCCNEDNTLLLKPLYCESQIKLWALYKSRQHAAWACKIKETSTTLLCGTLISHRTISILGKSITLIGIAHNFSNFFMLMTRGYMYMHPWVTVLNSTIDYIYIHIGESILYSFPSLKTLHADHLLLLDCMRFTTLV